MQLPQKVPLVIVKCQKKKKSCSVQMCSLETFTTARYQKATEAERSKGSVQNPSHGVNPPGALTDNGMPTKLGNFVAEKRGTPLPF